ncbi:MAG: signal peptide peptidase SppA [Mucinivorans sp.]
MGFGKTFLACLLAIVVGSILSFFFTIFIIAGFVSSISFLASEPVTIEKNSIMMIDLSKPIVETSSVKFADNFDFDSFSLKKNITTFEAVSMIDAAAEDPLIAGIYIKVSPTVEASLPTLYEVREALGRFRKNSVDKFIVAYGDTYSQEALYLCSVADKVYLNPAGAVDWSGMSATSVFFKGTLDKLGVEPEIIRHGKFKGAVEPFILDKMSDENRLQMQGIVSSTWNHVVDQIALSRSLSADTLQLLASDLRITSASDAMKAGLVDSIFYRDQLQTNLERLTGESELRLLTLNDYARSGKSINGDLSSPNKVAVVYASGDIVDMGDPATQIVGNDLAALIAKVRKDKDIKAMVLRVNSPGGSALASEVVRREVELTKKEKPVVVSMGEYAASGGYWISTPADAIVAAPTTLTGSIGVFGLMFNVEKGAREKLGVTFDVVRTNPSADLGSICRPLTRAERLVIQNGVDTTYNQFIEHVASGRRMNPQKVDSLGGGRVWSGLQALENGLVDKIGGMNDAIILAAEKAGITSYRISRMTGESGNSFSHILQDLSRASIGWAFGLDSKVSDAAVEIQNLFKEQGVKAAMENKIIFNL